MARPVVFDPTDPVLFDRQRQRFDWSLLQNGTVFRFDTVFQLDSACTHLNDLDYLVHRIDGHRWSSTADMYDAFAQVLSYDPSYGRGPDAFDDALSDVAAYTFGADPAATGTVMAVTGFDTLLRLDRRIAQLTLDSFARQARLAGLYGHPMLCLLHTSATDLGRVGGIEVQRGNVWDAEPDPPQPFEVTDRLEFIVALLRLRGRAGRRGRRAAQRAHRDVVGGGALADARPGTGAGPGGAPTGASACGSDRRRTATTSVAGTDRGTRRR